MQLRRAVSLEGRDDYLIILAALEHQAPTLKQSKSSGFARAASSELIDRRENSLKVRSGTRDAGGS